MMKPVFSVQLIDTKNCVHALVLRSFVAIRSFKDKRTEAVFNGRCPRGFPNDIFRVARRKLAYLDAAASLQVLKSPPGNRLEALLGGRRGQHSIRINDQFRLCFRWTETGPDDVEIIDYH